MIPNSVLPIPELDEAVEIGHEPTWAIRAMLLWKHRRKLARVTAISLLVSLAVSFAIPKQYKSTASIMPPDQQGSGSMLLAALAGHSGGLGALGGLASGLLDTHSSTALFINLLQSGTISGHLIDRFNLQHVYHKRYRIDTTKHLARCTKITEDKKSGVITIAVEDRSRVRARDLAQAYLDELNKLVTQTNTSAAHQERIFVERRLQEVQANLEDAEMQLSQFSSKSSAIDIKEQTRAMVDAGARVQAELLVEQSGLQSLRQIYGDGNVRVRETVARIASLQGELTKMTGSSAPLTAEAIHDDNTNSGGGDDKGELYPPLRQLPRLAVPYADLYRHVKVQETVFELLTQQYEMARIEEAKDVPVVRVIDPPGIPEKKSFPPRLLLTLLLTSLSFVGASALILVRDHWKKVDSADPRKMLVVEILPVLRRRISLLRLKRGAE
ncbi:MULTISPECIES: Wzz/FepE/Etk N-terminal domain-containing protein [Acidobacteriaceae]|uniref:GumC family protein n=1 Tax=Acidobacteriaceae TaxID=204434 RepID=UPI00131DBEEA|nr:MULTISPECIES: Wzz/FepE/Etk N-terminal domain-containing protein [Acidobacteriaceae]MDW5265153.1 Wzz/FepE/Etk N-terminal domain-containing protein [Edaphobacter sp.]